MTPIDMLPKMVRRRIVVACEQCGIFVVLVSLLIGSCVLARRFHVGEFSVVGALCVAAFALSLVAFLGWFLYVVHPWFQKWWVRIAGGCVLFVWGFVTYFYFPVNASDVDDFTSRILRATNRTSVTMFSNHGGAYGKPITLPARINFGAFQTALILYAAGVLFSLLGRTAMNGLQKLFVFDESRLHVFWGLTDRDRILAKSIRKSVPDAHIEFNLPQSARYNPVERARLTDLADRLRAFWMFQNLEPVDAPRDGDGSGAEAKRGAGFAIRSWAKGRYHYFLGEDGHRNMYMAERLADIIIGTSSIQGSWHFFVRAGDIDNAELFMNWSEDLYRRSKGHVEVSVIRDSELIARDFVSRFPPIASERLSRTMHGARVRAEGAFETLILGFDRVGREFLNVNLCISGFVGDGETMPIVRLPFTIVDWKFERWNRYLLSVPEIAARQDEYKLSFKNMQVGMTMFDRWFRREHARFGRIVFCMGDDATNIRECLRVCDILKEEFAVQDDVDAVGAKFRSPRFELFVRIEDPMLANVVSLAKLRSKNLEINVFGDLGRLYSYEKFHAEAIDKLAAVMHWQWGRSRNGDGDIDAINAVAGKRCRQDLWESIERKWCMADAYERRSSTVMVLRMLTFCRVWGFGLVGEANEYVKLRMLHDGRNVNVDEFEKTIFTNRKVLARLEYHWWCTYLFVCGYRACLDERSRQKMLGKSPNQIRTFRRHMGLAAYDPSDRMQAESCIMGWRMLPKAAGILGMCGSV